MLARAALGLILGSGISALAGCGTTLKNLKIPLVENSPSTFKDSPRVLIEDARAERERVAHAGKQISSCERWFGDDNFVPSKLTYLDRRVAQRTPSGVQVNIRLTRFDIVEYCESSPTGNSANAGPSAPSFTPAAIVGDTVVLRLAGEVNGVPFDESSQFDYGTLYWSPHLPSSYPAYRALLRSRLDEIIDRAMNSVWRARKSGEGKLHE